MHTYKGVDIFHEDSNSYGLRWYARTPDSWGDVPPVLRADSLKGIRQLIRHYFPNGRAS